MLGAKHSDDMTVLSPVRASTELRGSTRHGVAFWLIAAVYLVSQAFSTVPTPLYPIYQREDGFSAFTVTIVFAVYAVGVVASLLLAGHVSDWAGRRRILVPALATQALAGVLFLAWPALPGLVIARFLTGLGIGMITATATAYLLELHTAHRPAAGRARFDAVSAAANLGGLATGPLIAGALAQFAPAPLRTPYVVMLVLLALAIVAVVAVPETVIAPEVRPAYRPQRIRITRGSRTAYLVAAAAAFTSFAVFGLFTSLAPGFLAGSLHHGSRLLAGAVTFLVFATGAAMQAAPGKRRLTSGLIATAAGLVVLAAGVQATALWPFLAGGALAGAGAGILFKAAIGTVVGMAAPHERGETLAGLFLFGYLGLILPVIGVGVATQFVGATTAMLWFAGVMLALLAGVAILHRAGRAR